ncbi:MscL family protein, partial [Escherichia coli]|uniref:MscL family protein n=1 Tax=Escherichia coli TaxID=562 RepID=UPI003F2585B8
VLGTQVKTLVDQLVASFLNPLLGLILPGQGSLAEKTFSLTLRGKTEDFSYGMFITVLISFLTVAAVIYFIVKGLKLDKLDKP